MGALLAGCLNQLIIKQITIATKIVRPDSHINVSSGSNMTAKSGYMHVYMFLLQGLSADNFPDLFPL